MNGLAKRRAGQPIAVFLALVLGWTGMRLALWESPFPRMSPLNQVAAALGNPAGEQPAMAGGLLPHDPRMRASLPDAANRPIPPPLAITVDRPPPAPPIPADSAKRSAEQLKIMVSHQLLWLAAMGQVPVPADIARVLHASAAILPGVTSDRPSAQPPVPPRGAGPAGSARERRWSMDSWLFVRPDATLAVNAGPRFASYGASQAGAVLRYRLSPGGAARSAAYVRVTRALAVGRESEIAAGLSARPIPVIPVAAHAELRATRGAVKTQIRPAAFAVTQLPPINLPRGLRGETYLAAGYAGGDFPTAFVDGQARLDRALGGFNLGNTNRGTLRAGAGVWGGAQKGAARLDVGPSASVDVKLGAVPARFAVDYRYRAAGDAQPQSGVAFTLTTGF